ncbi:hypothetical protein ANOBCDAF_04553 [Pleomorphomonas sp. T1.2MG-36]|uniref:hypothetical protein n=1 Tax=Pleomorphomonas sp. T1.2MG-36 TaxID=3041167 RepID=UPI0024773E77|nr:hypothetical protein [Pleomorphomonas sp. T1.2MG-36]CAI9404104.1 hypothetical protein ANOBCDAF_04553 [Pleomorphomonas sp. T1.2MG-36]
MHKLTIVGVVAVAAALGACAKSPESISPSYVSEVGYQAWSCQQLSEETLRLSSAYAVAAQQQEKARTNDVVGVILIGLPVSSMSGDNIAPEIARLKGEQEAVRKAMVIKNCTPAAVPPPVVKAPAVKAPAVKTPAAKAPTAAAAPAAGQVAPMAPATPATQAPAKP